nr:ABC transporter permease [Lacticaseibacillus rhamnosus]
MEFKRQTRSLTFVIYTFLVVAFIVMNVWPLLSRNLTTLPKSPASYENITATDYQTLKTNSLDQLHYDYRHNLYTTYPLGFAKQVTLRAADQAKVRQLMTEAEDADTRAPLVKTLAKVDRLLGGQSAYSSQNIQNFAYRRMTKAEVVADQQLIRQRDRVTGAFARLFADIAGIMMGILPTIVAIAFCTADRRHHASAVIQTKAMTTPRLLLTRYVASLGSLFAPVIAIAIALTIQVAVLYQGMSLDYTAIVKMAFIWVLPTLMVSSAVGYLSAAIFGNFIGFGIQIGWWLVTMMAGARRVSGNYGWLLIPRHNSLHNGAYYYAHLDQLLQNRLGYALLALGLMALTAWILAAKRGGKLHALKFRSLRPIRN